MGKVKSGKAIQRQCYDEHEFGKWLIITGIYVIFVFVLYGTTSHYFPDPISLGLGLYGDIANAILVAAFAFWAAATGFKIVRMKNRGK